MATVSRRAQGKANARQHWLDTPATVRGIQFVLPNAIWEDASAFKFLIDRKAFDWAAAANIINGDDNAEAALERAGKKHFIMMAHAIQSVVRADGDRAVSPTGVIKSMLNFKKAFEKDPDYTSGNKDPKKLK